MNKITPIIFVLLLIAAGKSPAQVSHGGKPLAWDAQPGASTRSMEKEMFVEMPAFDVAEELRIDSLNESDLRSGYRFAYKFMTDYNRSNSGTSFTLNDGTRVWRLGIRSEGALSLNLLFTQYELPPGAQVFLYTPDGGQVLGSFNHLNNSELGILPVAPLAGDELIVEYQEPAKAAFPGKLTVGEVNHGYRSLRGDEPRPDRSDFKCMPAFACYVDRDSPYEPLGRSVVMMLIDGSIACTGTLVNNTLNDGKPYLLTASHCLNRSFNVTNPDYQKVAGRIVFFFNYNSPLCSTVMRGAEELSVASAKCNAINERTDLALLELLQQPPVHYQPYYAGWNLSPTPAPPYAGIHHPGGTVRRINWAEENVSLETFNTLGTHFNENSHWQVKEWSAGCTVGGSSGSALFDAEGRIVGALSGGQSQCSNPVNDFYYALNKSWTVSDEADKQLKHWLDPSDKEHLICDGLDPYKYSQCYRLSNVEASGHKEEIEATQVSATNTSPLFGNNTLGATEFAEAYTIPQSAKLLGVYFVTPAVAGNNKDLRVEVTVYSGSGKPQTLLHTEAFRPSYQNINMSSGTPQETEKPLNRAQESYIHFPKPVPVEGTFYIGYKITAAEGTAFSVFNLPKGTTTRNTTWVKYRNKWAEAPAYSSNPFNTSLFIDPVLQYETHVGVETVEENDPIHIYIDANRKIVHLLLPDGIKDANFTMLTLDGKILRSDAIRSNPCSIPVNEQTQGIYIVNVEYKGKKHAQKVFF